MDRIRGALKEFAEDVYLCSKREKDPYRCSRVIIDRSRDTKERIEFINSRAKLPQPTKVTLVTTYKFLKYLPSPIWWHVMNEKLRGPFGMCDLLENVLFIKCDGEEYNID